MNWTIRNLPHGYAVPGNHDCPYHDYKMRRKGAYWTLVEAGVLKDMRPSHPVEIGQARYWPFPFGFDVKPLKKPHSLAIEIAIVHAYVWTKTTGYFKAPKEQRLGKYLTKLRGYDVAFFGDNHLGFYDETKNGSVKGCKVFNCGGLQRRKSDERNYRPRVGLLHADGSVSSSYLNCSRDLFLDDKVTTRTIIQNNGDVRVFLDELNSLGDAAISFADAVRRAMDEGKVDGVVREEILKAMEEK